MLGHPKAIRRGMERLAVHLFDGLLETDDYAKLSFVATSYLAGACDFLIDRGLSPGDVLKCSPAQLRRSRIALHLSNLVQ